MLRFPRFGRMLAEASARLAPMAVAIGLLLAAIASSALAQGAPAHVGPDSLYPDPTLAPGAVFDGVNADQVCVPGYASSVRDVTFAERAQVYAEYSIADVPGFAEVDHFVPLELGGSNDITNLWVEPYQPTPGAHTAFLFRSLGRMPCAGEWTKKSTWRAPTSSTGKRAGWSSWPRCLTGAGPCRPSSLLSQ